VADTLAPCLRETVSETKRGGVIAYISWTLLGTGPPVTTSGAMADMDVLWLWHVCAKAV